MCGIAGILGVTDPEQAERDVRAMIERIAHRGPNGIRVESGPGWCVAHARLSIIDLEGGWQPLHGAGSTVIGNGEIYNYLELTEEFQLKDKLATGSDFEPLLHIYAQEGEKAFERLRGMYAFCFIGCAAAGLRSRIASRRCARASRPSSSSARPSPSGPRCASVAAKRAIVALSTGDPSTFQMPAMPHIPRSGPFHARSPRSIGAPAALRHGPRHGIFAATVPAVHPAVTPAL